MSKLIYISHPYGGKKENFKKIDNIVRGLSLKYPEFTFVSPVHTFGFLYDDVDYETGLRYCLDLLDKCDEMWLCSEKYQDSKGCIAEIAYCKGKDMTYYMMNNKICLGINTDDPTLPIVIETKSMLKDILIKIEATSKESEDKAL